MSVRAVILGGRSGRRRVDAARSQPAALLEARDRPVIDWILAALRAARVAPIGYVGGYQLQQVMAAHPELAYRFHAAWQTEGELSALLAAVEPDGGDDILIVRADTVLRTEAVEALLQAPGAIVSGARHRPGGAPAAAGTVLVRRSHRSAALEAARVLHAGDPTAGLDQLVARLGPVAVVDLTNLAAPVDQPEALLGTIFRGKARTLDGIARLTTRAVVLDQVRFTAEEWSVQSETVLERIEDEFSATRVVVRSSSTSEDAAGSSEAGRFRSVLDVPVADRAAVIDAIDEVVASYASGGRVANPADEVLVQAHVRDLAANGVVFTRDLSSGAPAFLVSIDRTAGRSDVVTSGASGSIETHAISWAADDADLDRVDPDIARVVRLARELIGLAYLDALDIEFGIGHAGTLFLFQVRPLAARPSAEAVADDDVLAMVRAARTFVEERLAERPGVPGRRSLLGNMPDWNPAEMIGAAPRPLALSLYQRLVGDRAWARARARLGYRDLEPEPLILSVGGRPYVDVRASLASFLPPGLDEVTAARWIDACVERLAAEPSLHDKIEFEVTPTCLAFDWLVHAGRMRAAGLDGRAIERFRAGLAGITGGMLTGGDHAVRLELAAIGRLADLRARAGDRPADGVAGLGRALRDHVERTERHGLEPFAAAAREAFVAMALLRSLVGRGVLSVEELDEVLRSIPTVATETIHAIDAVGAGRLPIEVFVRQFGHLRSSSYEVTAPNYAASLDRVLGGGGRAGVGLEGVDTARADALLRAATPAIERLLGEAGLPGTAASFVAFARAAIAARERLKFEFMKDLDLVLGTAAALGAELGLTPDDVSFLHLDDLLRLATDSADGATGARLRRASGQARKRAALTAAVRLPDLIRSGLDVVAVHQAPGTPNFVTTGQVTGPVVALDELATDAMAPHLDGAIVAIRAADPGYDWIFSHPIAGLVTQYGGMGSHMAIRAAEFGLPAAIGCGEAIFETVRAAAAIELDGANRRIRPVVLPAATPRELAA